MILAYTIHYKVILLEDDTETEGPDGVITGQYNGKQDSFTEAVLSYATTAAKATLGNTNFKVKILSTETNTLSR